MRKNVKCLNCELLTAQKIAHITCVYNTIFDEVVCMDWINY